MPETTYGLRSKLHESNLRTYENLGIVYLTHGAHAGIVSIAPSSVPIDAHQMRVDSVKAAIPLDGISELSRYNDYRTARGILNRLYQREIPNVGGPYFILLYGTDGENPSTPIGVVLTHGHVRNSKDLVFYRDGSPVMGVMVGSSGMQHLPLRAMSTRIHEKMGPIINSFGSKVHADAARHLPISPSRALGLEHRI